MLWGMRKLVLAIALLIDVGMVGLLLLVGSLYVFGPPGAVPLEDRGVAGLAIMLLLFGFSAVALAGLVFGLPRLAGCLNDALVAGFLLALLALFVLVSTLLQGRWDMLSAVVVFCLICLGNLGFLGIEKYYQKA